MDRERLTVRRIGIVLMVMVAMAVSGLAEKRRVCKHEGCENEALFLSEFCAEHVEDWEGYREKIEKWVAADKSLEGARLKGANLHGADLRGADLKGANLWKANLQKAQMAIANLQEAILTEANLQEAKLFETNLQKATLVKANLKMTNFNMADFRGAKLFNNTMQETNLNLARLDNALILFENLPDVYMDKTGHFWATKEAEGTYRTLKNYYKGLGEYDRYSLFHVLEWRARTFQMRIYSPLRWMYHAVDLLCGYGEAPFRVIAAWVVFTFGFCLFYFWTNGIKSSGEHTLPVTFLNALYFSVVTFTTLGYGDFQPANKKARIAAMLEASIGAFMIALFVLVFGRKMMR